MADKATFDPVNKLIILKPGVTAIDVEIDLYSDAKEEWLADEELNKYKFPFRVVGGDTTEGEQAIAGYFYLKYGWRVRPQEANHLLTITGILLVDGGGDPFVNTLGNYNVRIKYVIPLQAVKVITGSGITEQDKQDIADRVLDEPTQEHSGAGSLGATVASAETLSGAVKNAVLGRWKIAGTQMIFYAEDNATEIARFDLMDANGLPVSNPGKVFERARV